MREGAEDGMSECKHYFSNLKDDYKIDNVKCDHCGMTYYQFLMQEILFWKKKESDLRAKLAKANLETCHVTNCKTVGVLQLQIDEYKAKLGAAMQWISVKNRLPEDGQTVDIFSKAGKKYADCTFYLDSRIFANTDRDFSQSMVTHWRHSANDRPEEDRP